MRGAERMCQVCGSGEGLHGHHTAYEPERIVTLCASCHGLVHRGSVAGVHRLRRRAGVSAATRLVQVWRDTDPRKRSGFDR